MTDYLDFNIDGLFEFQYWRIMWISILTDYLNFNIDGLFEFQYRRIMWIPILTDYLNFNIDGLCEFQYWRIIRISILTDYLNFDIDGLCEFQYWRIIWISIVTDCVNFNTDGLFEFQYWRIIWISILTDYLNFLFERDEIIRLITNLLTYYKEQSPSCKANRFSAGQVIPRILWNTKVHYRSHKCPPPVPIQGQLEPVNTSTSHFLKIRLKITLISTPASSNWFLFLQFPPPPLCIHLSSSPIRATCPSHSSRVDHLNTIDKINRIK